MPHDGTTNNDNSRTITLEAVPGHVDHPQNSLTMVTQPVTITLPGHVDHPIETSSQHPIYALGEEELALTWEDDNSASTEIFSTRTSSSSSPTVLRPGVTIFDLEFPPDLPATPLESGEWGLTYKKVANKV